MAFGKKGKQDEALAPAAAPVEEPPAVEALSGALSTEAEAAQAEVAADAPAEAPAPSVEAPAADAGDALTGDLLNMFQTTQIETADLSVVLELAGDVDIADLMEELNTLAAALGIARSAEYEAA